MQLWHPELKKLIDVSESTAAVLEKSGWKKDVPKSHQDDEAANTVTAATKEK